MKKTVSILLSLLAAAAISSCTVSDDLDDSFPEGPKGEGYDPSSYGERTDDGGDVPTPGEGGEGEGESTGNGQAGRVTAGEWNDLNHWTFWSNLMTGQEYSEMSGYWKFWTNNRVAFRVSDKEGKPISGVTLSLERGGSVIWTAVTDNRGRADGWIGLTQKEEKPTGISLRINGKDWEGTPAITTWDTTEQQLQMNEIVLEGVSPAAEKADIAFIVDATGSMGDEIAFLKEDLLDILKKVDALQSSVTFRTGALFYRDEGDDYVTRTNDFTTDFSKTTAFIAKQDANGGGDYPEAVHTALEVGLQQLSWDENAKTRLAFMLLDAPAHHRDDVIQSLQKSIPLYAKQGIRIIPIAASGVDKSTEFMLRFFAVTTGGTYVFITNDSGIGGDHIAASVGDYEVELLNELIVRLIKEYTD